MKYYTDRAITHKENDLLNRASFSEQLGKAIYNYNGNDSLVIGLYGKWGMGKTSIANMILQTIEKQSESEKKKNKKNKPIIIRFAPWNYSDKDNLIGQFFEVLRAKVYSHGNDKLKERVGTALTEYSKLFDIAHLIPGYGAVLATALKAIFQVSGNALAENIDLEETKEKLIKGLNELDQKIIVLIDDIDRLTNQQIRDIFQLVKQVGDLPKITYILAMDRDNVVRALGKVNDYDGNEYLEKIVQIAVDVPEIDRAKIQKLFFENINTVLNAVAEKVDYEQEYWDVIYLNCIDPYLYTIRDVNRLINTFQLRYEFMHRETIFEDVMAITTVEVMDPGLYKWISNNKELICGEYGYGIRVENNAYKERKNRLEHEFVDSGIDPDRAIMLLSTLFPAVSYYLGEFVPDYQRLSPDRNRMRISRKDRFELYFTWNLDSVRISKEVLDNACFTADEKELRKIIIEINEQGNIGCFLDGLRDLADNIPPDQLERIIPVLIEKRNTFNEGEREGFIALSVSSLSAIVIEKFMKMLPDDNKRYDILKQCIDKADAYSIESIARQIIHAEQAYSGIKDLDGREERRIVNEKQLKSLERDYVNVMKKFAASDEFLDILELPVALELWEHLDGEGVQEFLKNKKDDSLFALKFICKFSNYRKTSEGRTEIYFNRSISMKYYPDDMIYEMIQDFDKSKLCHFDEKEQTLLGAFYLGYKNKKCITEDEALKIVAKWKKTN